MVVAFGLAGFLWETFGVFLLPSGVFVVGVVLYVVLWWLGRARPSGRGDRER